MKKSQVGHGCVRAFAIVFALMFLSGSSLAETHVTKRGKAVADGLVVVENIAGSIEIIGWSQNEVKVEGDLSSEVKELEFKSSGNKTTIKVKYPQNINSINSGADLVIYVPKGSQLEIECVSCPVEIKSVEGNVSVEGISGSITLEGNCPEVEIECISGKISVAGDIKELEMETISGKIEASGQRCNVSANSITGGIELTFDEYIGLEVESVDSKVLVEGALAKGGEMELESVSGNITLVLPSDICAEFEIETFSGSIGNAFGHKATKISQYAPGKELEFVTGSGDGRISISTFSGDIKIKP